MGKLILNSGEESPRPMGAPYTVGLAGFGAAFGTLAGGSISSRFALENVLMGFKSPGIIDSDPSSSSEKAFNGGNFFSISSGFLEKVLTTGFEGGSLHGAVNKVTNLSSHLGL